MNSFHTISKGFRPFFCFRVVFIIAAAGLISHVGRAQNLKWVPLSTGSESSFRGLSVVNDSTAWLAGSLGNVGVSSNGGKSWQFTQIQGFEKVDFRSIYAFDGRSAVVATAGLPATILRTSDGGKSWKEVYINSHPDAFFDGIDFWNDSQGIIYGDPIDGKMLLLKTMDGGKTWQPMSNPPILEKGEASFAASGTGIHCRSDGSVWIATGGFRSRLWLSSDKGKSWKRYETPILQGKNSQGIFSFGFLGEKTICLVGGDYLSDSVRKDHIFISSDWGKSWQKPQKPTRGYRECVEVIHTTLLIATGPSGTDVSMDGGLNWEPLSDEKGFHVVKKARNGKLVLVAGSKGQLAEIRMSD